MTAANNEVNKTDPKTAEETKRISSLQAALRQQEEDFRRTPSSGLGEVLEQEIDLSRDSATKDDIKDLETEASHAQDAAGSGPSKVTSNGEKKSHVVKAVTSSSLVEAKLKAVETKSVSKDPAPSSTPLIRLSDVKAKQMALRVGVFEFDDGTLGDFVYVPKGYNFFDEEKFDAILAALKMQPPELCFLFSKNHTVVPNIDKKEVMEYASLKKEHSPNERWVARDDLKYPDPVKYAEYIRTQETRVENFLDGLSMACSQTRSVYLLAEPFGNNRFSELASESAANCGVPALGLFDADFGLTYVDKKLPKPDLNFEFEHNTDKGYKAVPYGRSVKWDPRRKRILSDVFSNPEVVVAMGDTPDVAIKVTGNRTPYEEKYFRKFRCHHIHGALAGKCSHRLVFASSGERKKFERLFVEKYPTGGLIVGIGSSELDVLVDALRRNRPLFVLTNTGSTSNAAELLLSYGKFIRSKKYQTMDENAKWQDFDARFPPKGDVGLKTTLPTPLFGNDDARRKERITLEQELGSDTIWEETRAIARTFASFAPHFNDESNVVIDMAQPFEIDVMQDKITKVMSSAFDFEPELGGLGRDRDVLVRARNLRYLLEKASLRYKRESDFLQYVTRIILFVIVVLSVVQNESIIESDSAAEALRVTNIILPLLASGLLAYEAAFRPSFKYCALLLAEKRVEGEMYRYRTRTGEYRKILHKRGRHTKAKLGTSRAVFSQRCQEIYDECLKSDMSSGTLWTLRGSKDTSNAMAPWAPSSSLMHDTNREDVEARSQTQQMKLPEGFYKETDPSVLTGEKYIKDRILPVLEKFHKEVPGLTSTLKAMQGLIIALTAISTAFVAFEIEQWVPVLLAASTFFEFFKKYLLIENRVPNLNGVTTELTKVLFWWDGLTRIESRVASSKDELIDRAEDALIASYEQFAGSTMKLARKRYSDIDNGDLPPGIESIATQNEKLKSLVQQKSR